jgi:uncharacterized membrane protein/cytochrome c2
MGDLGTKAPCHRSHHQTEKKKSRMRLSRPTRSRITRLSTHPKIARMVLGLIALALAAVGVARAAPGDEKLDPQTKARIERFEKGAATVDVSKYPKDIQQNYETFQQKCAQCHKLTRPINADYATAEEWSRCVKRMKHKEGSDISNAEGAKIYEFLVYDASLRKQAAADGALAKAPKSTTDRGEKQGPSRTGATPGNSILFFGHFHPLLVHLPIGGLALLGILELLTMFSRFKDAAQNSRLLLGFVSVAALVAAVCGWLLSQAGGYDGQLLRWHKWAGVSVAVSCWIAFLLRLLNWQRAYRVCLCATLTALLVASHLGGSMTYGRDFLTRYAPAPIRSFFGKRSALAAGAAGAAQPPDQAQQVAFAEVAQPILVRRCSGCHGAQKQKNMLRLDSLQGLIEGGESGPALVAGNAGQSLLVQRLLLPSNDEHHMPPEAEPQPASGEIEALQSWINASAGAGLNGADPKPGGAGERVPPAVPPTAK